MIVIVNKWWMKWVASIAYRLKGSDQVYAAQSLFIFIILREKEFENCERLIHHEKNSFLATSRNAFYFSLVAVFSFLSF
jgi:hypothetical protein